MTNSIKVERARKNITQGQLAEMVSVSRQTINAIELGKYNPSTVLSLKMSRVFEVSVNDLFCLEDGD
jgi:transcriptional regulator